MPRSDRLHTLLHILRDGELHTAQDLAAALQVSTRTIYRDMEVMLASGVPVRGNRGIGYQATGAITLPPMTISEQELEALNLGIAIVSEAADPDLARAAQSLGDTLDRLLPQHAISPSDDWKFAQYPFASASQGLAHLPTIRSGIKARQKLQLIYKNSTGADMHLTIHPLRIDHWGRIWTLTAWSETEHKEVDLRLDLIQTATPLPELFDIQAETSKS